MTPAFSARLLQIQQTIQSGTRWLGRSVAWLTLGMVLLTCLVVVLRYGFNLGSVALQESVIYLHGCVFLLALAYTADCDEHVRVDIFYSRFSVANKAWVNCIGSLVLLLPFAVYLLWASWPFFINALEIREASGEAGGLIYLYLFKGLLPLAALSLVLQGLGQVFGNLGVLLREQQP